MQRPLSNVRARGDEGRIAQVLDNVLNNALKYSGPSAPIEVSLTVALIFTPFFRTSRTRQASGTGLGLHISKRLAERHGGGLWLEASSSSGSVFALALPVATSPRRKTKEHPFGCSFSSAREGGLGLRLRGDAELRHEVGLVEVGALALDQTVAERRDEHRLEDDGLVRRRDRSRR